MGSKDPRVDAYIARSAPFARPILARLRALVHRGCPGVEETIKWGFPHFVSEGAILCSMAAFRSHCAFGFWKASLIPGAKRDDDAMGQFGRIASLADLPGEAGLLRLIREAARLNAEGVKVERPRRAPKPELPVPAALAAALRKNRAARATFEGFPPGKRRDYVEWIAEAKADATRERRVRTAVEWMAEGKSRNWKYERQGPEKSSPRR